MDALPPIKDERFGLESASSIERFFKCHGSRYLELLAESQAVIPDGKGESAAASKGTLLHAANETGDITELVESDAEQVVRIRKLEEEIVRQWVSDLNLNFEKLVIVREKRFWFPKDAPRVSGKGDLIVLSECGKHCLIADAKTGRKEVTPSSRNWQCRTLAVAARAELGFETCRTAIVPVWCKVQPPCDYSSEDLDACARILQSHLEHIRNPGLPLTPGNHCTYCKAVHTCSALRPQMSVAITSQRTLDWSLVTPESRKPLWIAADMAEKAGKAIKEQLRADLVNDPACAPGLLKKKDGTTRKIVDVTEAFKTLVLEVPIPVEELSEELLMCEFIKECSIGLADYIAFVRSKTDMTKEQAARFIEEKCSSFIETSPRSGSVEVVD